MAIGKINEFNNFNIEKFYNELKQILVSAEELNNTSYGRPKIKICKQEEEDNVDGYCLKPQTADTFLSRKATYNR